ncbi:MAG: heme exporter protein D [Gammaproteobacteria bacterium]|jgi:heme exporter protein D
MGNISRKNGVKAMSDFFAMGGYAFYVWSSVGISVVVLVWNIISPLLKRQALLREVTAQITRKQKKHEAKT